MVTLSSVRLPVVEPRRRMRTWVPPAARSVWLNLWTMQNPSTPAWSVVSVPGGAVNAAVNVNVVADTVADGADLTSWGTSFWKPSTTMAKTRYSCAFPHRGWDGETWCRRRGRFPRTRPRAPRCSRLNSVAVAEALFQERSIWSMLTGVATRFTGAAGKTVAEDMSEGSETSPSSRARTR